MCMAQGCQKNLRLHGVELQVVVNFEEAVVVCVWEWRLSSSSCGALRKPHLQGVDFIAPSIELVGFGANFRLTTLVVLLSWKHF